MEENRDISFINIGQILWKHRRTFIIGGFIAAILGAIVAFLIPVYYRATAVIYPPAITYIPATEDFYYNRGNVNEFGDIEEAEQVLELFNSQDFQDRVIDSMKLYEHYNIEPNQPSSKYYMTGLYREMISAGRSKFSAVKFNVLDKSPEKAAEIAEFIVNDLNNFRTEIIRKRIKSNANIIIKQRDSLQNSMTLLEDSLNVFEEMGVVSKQERSSILRAMGSAQRSNPEVAKIIDANIKYGSTYSLIEENLLNTQRLLFNTNEILLQWEANASKDANNQFIVEHPQVPDRRFSPKRTIVLIVVVITSLILLLFYLYIKENWPKFREKLEE